MSMLEKAQERLQFCYQCPSYNKAHFCEECGCFIPAKVMIPTAKCPLDKW